MTETSTIDRLTTPKLLAVYALLLHLAVQIFGGYEASRAFAAPDADSGWFASFCLPGSSTQSLPDGQDGPTKPGQACSICHVHCAALALIPVLAAVLLALSFQNITWNSLRWRAPAQLSRGLPLCRGPPAR